MSLNLFWSEDFQVKALTMAFADDTGTAVESPVSAIADAGAQVLELPTNAVALVVSLIEESEWKIEMAKDDVPTWEDGDYTVVTETDGAREWSIPLGPNIKQVRLTNNSGGARDLNFHFLIDEALVTS